MHKENFVEVFQQTFIKMPFKLQIFAKPFLYLDKKYFVTHLHFPC